MDNYKAIAELEAEIKKLKQKNTELEALIKYYEEQIRLAKQKQFGSSSEKTAMPEQIGLFDEVENTADKKLDEPTVQEVVVRSHKKRVGKREEDLSGLPVEIIEYSIPENEQLCPECGESLHKMTTEIRRELVIIPAKVKVIEHVSNVYSCRNCEKNDISTPIIKADSPEPLIKGSLASASVVAEIMVQKYVNAVPLYRQEKNFIRNGISLSRQTMANWVIFCALFWLKPIYELMKSTLLECSVLHADETLVQVLNEPGKKANTNSYEWLYRTSGDAENAIVLYEYQPTRSSSHPKAFLKDFKGYLHTDGYQGYHNLSEDIIVVGCWAHVRRKFNDALKSVPAPERENSQSIIGLNFCNKLFELEREFQNLPPEERYQKRTELSLPVAEAFFSWAKGFGTLPKSAFRTAIEYFTGQWSYLKNVFLDGRLELSNNRAERSIKPFVIGRKNWLFSNTKKGAEASSIVYSVIETAIENGLNPFEYLKSLFEAMPSSTTADLANLLPWSNSLPDNCFAGKKDSKPSV